MQEKRVNEIFASFEGMYGHQWSSRHQGIAEWKNAKANWEVYISEMSYVEIERAMRNLPKMPPSAPEFKALGKPLAEEQKTHHAAYKLFQPAPKTQSLPDPAKKLAAEQAREEIRRRFGIKR